MKKNVMFIILILFIPLFSFAQDIDSQLKDAKKVEGFFTFYWLTNNSLDSRNNDYVKLKDMNFNFLIETLINIFPKLKIVTSI